MSESCPCGATLGRERFETGARFERPYRLLECPRCGLVSPAPFPTVAELGHLYDGYGSYGDEATRRAAKGSNRAAAERLVRTRLARLLGRPPSPPRYLELGCAAGDFLAAVAEVAPFECWGIEVDPGNAEVARRALPGRVHTGTLETAPYPEAHFGVVHCNQVIEHVPDPPSFLAATLRVLAPGGVALFATPNFRGLSARVLGLDWKEYAPTEHVRMFDPRSLRFHLEQAGFVDVVVATQGLSMKRRDRSDALPLDRARVPARVLSKGLGALGLGDTLSASARRRAHA